MISLRKHAPLTSLAPMMLSLASIGCDSKHPQAIQASPEQQKKWDDEENAESQRKLDEARARGAVQ
jgi:hypothetical protein